METIKPILPIVIIALLGLVGCSSEEELMKPVESEKPKVAMELLPYMSAYKEAVAGTRAWIPPTGYYLYNDPLHGSGGMFAGQPDLSTKTIGICFTQDGEEPKKGYFVYSGGKWLTNVEEIKGEPYYLYGYIPHIGGVDAVTCDISSSATPGDNTSYSSGAVLTIHNLPTVTSNDVCVVVGAKNGKDDYTEEGDYSVTGLRPGDFEYVAEETSDEGATGNYVFLLFDHLYSAVRFRIKVWETYNALRKIKLKELKIQTFAGASPCKSKTDVAITFAATDGVDPSDPVVTDVVFTPSSGINSEAPIFQSEGGDSLTTEYSTFMGNFMPQGVTKLVLTSTYDVYDRNPVKDEEGNIKFEDDERKYPVFNLIRKDQHATNVLELERMQFFPIEKEATRGKCYNINLTIKPSYLLQLSDEDLNNPTMEID